MLGDYRFTNRDIHFIRCDADPKFVGHESWLQMLGIRFYVAPAGVKTSRAERAVRTAKETIRTINNSLVYRPPKVFIPSMVYYSITMLTLRYSKRINMSPREKIFGERILYDQLKLRYGDVISYQAKRNTSSSLNDRLSYGVVTGIDLRTGAYTVFNLGDHHEEEIGVYRSVITVDAALVDYFNNFENRGGFTYENGRAVYVAVLEANNHREKMDVALLEANNHREKMDLALLESSHHREKVEVDSNSQINRRSDYSMVESINKTNPISPMGSRDCRRYSDKDPITADVMH